MYIVFKYENMPIGFETIDELIHNEKLNYDCKMYTSSGKLPDNYFTETKIVHSQITPIDDLKHLFITNTHDKVCLQQSIQKCIDIETELLQYTNNDCSVCYEMIDKTNYVLPNCGHKICISCYSNNLLKNIHTGKKCAVCRSQIYT